MEWTKRGDFIAMGKKSAKGGKYLREAPKKTKKRNTALIVVICISVTVLVCLVGVLFMPRQSVYQTIVRNGYAGTQEQWLAALVGETVNSGSTKTAYELAVEKGYKGTAQNWIQTITGSGAAESQKSMYQIACENGFSGSLTEWLNSIADRPESLGRSEDGKPKTEYELACEYGYTGTFIQWIVSMVEIPE